MLTIIKKNKEKNQKKSHERYQNFTGKERKSNNMVTNSIKIFQNQKHKGYYPIKTVYDKNNPLKV